MVHFIQIVAFINNRCINQGFLNRIKSQTCNRIFVELLGLNILRGFEISNKHLLQHWHMIKISCIYLQHYQIFLVGSQEE